MGPQILTIEEVAEMLRVSERTVYDWAQRGEIPGGKLGTSWRFVRTEIDAWVTRKLMPRKLTVPSQAAASVESVLKIERVFLIDAITKAEALGVLVDSLVNAPGVLSRDELWEAVVAREQLMSTGLGLGIGVPHARLNGVTSVHAAMAVCKAPLVDYDSIDDTPVSIIVMILAGREQHALYINTLASVTRILKDADTRDAVLQASSTVGLYSAMTGKVPA